MKKSYVISAVLAGILMSGCGGGSGSSTQNQTSDISDTSSGASVETTAALRGTAADGYLIGATVCIDENINMACDENETTTTTGDDGYYEFEDMVTSEYPIVVEVTTDTVDSDTNETVSEAYVLVSNNENGGFISPLTTMIYEYYAANADSNITIAEAREAVASELGLESTDQLFTDYMVDGNISGLTEEEIAAKREMHDELHAIAKLLVYTKHEVKDLVSQTLAQSGSEYNATEGMDEDAEAVSMICSKHMFGELKGIKSKAKSMHGKHESDYNVEGQTIGQSLDINSTSWQDAVDGVKYFKANKHGMKVVSGTVSTGTITITSTDEDNTTTDSETTTDEDNTTTDDSNTTEVIE